MYVCISHNRIIYTTGLVFKNILYVCLAAHLKGEVVSAAELQYLVTELWRRCKAVV